MRETWWSCCYRCGGGRLGVGVSVDDHLFGAGGRKSHPKSHTTYHPNGFRPCAHRATHTIPTLPFCHTSPSPLAALYLAWPPAKDFPSPCPCPPSLELTSPSLFYCRCSPSPPSGTWRCSASPRCVCVWGGGASGGEESVWRGVGGAASRRLLGVVPPPHCVPNHSPRPPPLAPSLPPPQVSAPWSVVRTPPPPLPPVPPSILNPPFPLLGWLPGHGPGVQPAL